MLSASVPSASSMAIASRTIAARLSAGCSRFSLAHTEGVRSPRIAPPAYIVRIQAYINKNLRTPSPDAYSVRIRRNTVRSQRKLDMENRDPRRWWILIVLCLSSLVLVVDSMALTVAVPRMTADLHASAQETQWILDSYILVFAGLLLTSGGLGDRFGRRKVMIIGLLLFGAASLAATFAATPGQVIAARVLMGTGGALIMPSTLSILITVFDDAERPKAMAAWTSVAMLGLVGSPVLGGVLIARFSWHAIFFINVPVVALAVAAGLVLMPESKGPWQRPDPLGAVLSAAGMTALVWWIIGLPAHGAVRRRAGRHPGRRGPRPDRVRGLGEHHRRADGAAGPVQAPQLHRRLGVAGPAADRQRRPAAGVHPVPAVRARLEPGQGRPGLHPAGHHRADRQRRGAKLTTQDRPPRPDAGRDGGHGRLVRRC